MSDTTVQTQTNVSITNDDDDEWTLTHDAIVEENNSVITIPKTSDYLRNTDGSQEAILRSLRAAGVKFLRYAIVDSYNVSIWCTRLSSESYFVNY